MNASRLAVWIVGAAVSGAWLASAAGVTRQARNVRVPPPAPETVQLDALAAEVQTQAGSYAWTAATSFVSGSRTRPRHEWPGEILSASIQRR